MRKLIFLTLILPTLVWASNPCPPLLEKGFIKLGYQVDAGNGKLSFHIVEKSEVVNSSFNFLMRALLVPAFSLDRLDNATAKLVADKRTDVPFFDKLRDATELKANVQNYNVPASGPTIFTMNHSRAGLEAIAAAPEIFKTRKDLKLVVTTMLGPIPGMSENAFFMNLNKGREAKISNAKTIEEVKQHLKNGGSILIFPAGVVARKTNLSDPYAMETLWKWTTAKLLKEIPETQLVPIFADGQPSQSFQVAKKISPTLGTAFIFKEIAEGTGGEISFKFGPTLKAEDLNKIGDPSQVMEYLRARTYAMGDAAKQKRAEEPLAKKIPLTHIADELSRTEILFDSNPENVRKGTKVFVATGKQIPFTMLELGRLRELTFRPVGEGTGKPRDIDAYDAHYTQLIAWDKEKNQISGAYRIAKLDEVKKHYTSELVDTSNVIKLGKVLELSRSFVHPDYQRRSRTLFILWEAIGRYLLLNSEYRYLMGAVSISNTYSESSKLLMTEFLRRNYSHDLSIAVKIPPQFKSLLTPKEVDIILKAHPTLESLSDFITQLENDPSRGIPTLIPLYIKMGNRFLGFNFDPAFNTVDGIIITDLKKASVKELKKYMGAGEAQWWLNN